MDTQLPTRPDLGSLAITLESQARRRAAAAEAERTRRETDGSTSTSPSSPSPRSSMAWLMGPERVNAAAAAASSTSPSSPVCPAPPPSAEGIPGSEPGEDLAGMLVRLSRACADMFNSRLYEEHWAAAYYADDFRACIAQRGGWMPLRACTEHFRGVARDRPRLHFSVTEGTASVDERGGVARVFQNVDVSGQSPGMVGHEVVVLEWTRQPDGRWMCTELMGFRGVLGSVL